jgi:chitinase
VPYSTGYGVSGPLVTTTADAAGTVVLSWVPLPQALQYRIYELIPGSISQFNVVISQPQTIGGISVTATVSGLAPGSIHTYQVRAVDSAGIETVVPASSTAVAGLLPPISVTVAARTSTTITLTWTPSPSPGVTTYTVQQSLNPAGPFGPSVLASASTSGATVGGLIPNTTYYFTVTAITSGGVASVPSPAIVATTTP